MKAAANLICSFTKCETLISEVEKIKSVLFEGVKSCIQKENKPTKKTHLSSVTG